MGRKKKDNKEFKKATKRSVKIHKSMKKEEKKYRKEQEAKKNPKKRAKMEKKARKFDTKMEKKLKKNQSLFYEPAKYKKYSKLIDTTKPTRTRKKLLEEFNEAKQLEKKKRIAKIATLTANRLNATKKRRDLTVETKKRINYSADHFEKTSQMLWNKYNLEKKKKQTKNGRKKG